MLSLPVLSQTLLSRRSFLGGMSALAVLGAAPAQAQTPAYRLRQTEIEVFPNKLPGDYSHFRIPSLAATPKGALVAFCEGRRSRRDYGDTDILMKVSRDGGKIWLNPACSFASDGSCDSTSARRHAVVIGATDFFPHAQVNWRNPTVVMAKGVLHLLLVVDEAGEEQKHIIKGDSKYHSRLFHMRTLTPESDWEDGVVWSEPREILLDQPFRFAQFGPGRGIMNKGRILIPAAINNGSVKESMSFALYSDDGGETWQASGKAGKATEVQITQLGGNRILMSKRAKGTQDFYRSDNNGETWKALKQTGDTLVTPTVQTGLITDAAGRVIVTAPNHPADRVDTSLFISDPFKKAANWQGPYPLEPDKRCTTKVDCSNTQGYSCPGLLPDGALAVLYEDSKKGEPYRRINLALFEPN